MDPTKQPGVQIEAVVLDGFEIFRGPDSRVKEDQAFNFDLRFQKRATVFEDGKSGSATLSVFMAEKTTDFRISCTYALIGRSIEGAENLQIGDFLGLQALAILYQYARELISNMAMRSGVQNLVLPPMNFAAMQWVENVQSSNTAEKV